MKDRETVETFNMNSVNSVVSAADMKLPPGEVIRLMTAADLADVHLIERAVQSAPWTPDQFAAELENPAATVSLYCIDGQVAGFLCSWLIAGELQIQNVATHPGFRRRGVAASLLAVVLERSSKAGLESAWLEVRAGNVPAITLYERFGFSSVARRAGYYADGEDAVIMCYKP